MSDIETLEGGSHDGALYLGLDEGERVYWDYRTNELVKQDEWETFKLDEEWVGRYIRRAEQNGHWGQSSRLGAFLAAVDEFDDAPGMLGRQQALVYAVRDLGRVSRTHAARALDMNKSTLDTTLQTARRKVDAFKAVGEALSDG